MNFGDNLLNSEKNDNLTSTILLYFCIAIMLALLFLVFFFQACHISGESMLNTLHDNDDVLVTRFSSNYKIDDIIILTVKDAGEDKNLVKRIVAVENETFKFVRENNFIYLYKLSGEEWQKKDEPYIKEDMKPFTNGNYFFKVGDEYTVPAGSVLYLGDNRNNSNDSRFYGYANNSSIIGKVVYTTRENTFQNFLLNLLFNSKSLIHNEH